MKAWHIKATTFLAGIAMSTISSIFLLDLVPEQVVAQKENSAARSTILVTQELSSYLKDAERGQRGYLLNKEKTDLTTYKTGVLLTKVTLDRLEKLVQDQPAELERLQETKDLIQAKLAEMDETIAAPPQKALKIFATDKGARLANLIQAQINAINSIQSSRLDASNDVLQTQNTKIFCYVVLILSGIVAAVISGFLAYRQGLNFQIEAAKTETARTTELLKKLETISQRRTAEIRGLAHDFRGYLSGIQGYIEINEILEDDKTKIRRLIKTAANITEDLNLAIQIEETGLKPFKEKLDLIHLVQNQIDSIVAIKHEIKFEVRGEIQLVLADQRLASRAIANLLSNAIKYSQEGVIGVCVTFNTDFVRIEVADQGEGIPENELNRVFEPYHRISNAASNKEGLGVGLTIVKAFAISHGGTVTAKSFPGLKIGSLEEDFVTVFDMQISLR